MYINIDIRLPKRTALNICTIHNTPNKGFEGCLLRISKLYFGDSNNVEYATSLFVINAPKWLQKRVFGYVTF
jgi:hypothetical protein